jgi:tetratricopeptide (TPR) repeat protein
MGKGMEQLKALKALGAEHLKEGRYSEAAVYFRDILARFDQEAQHITSETEMEEAIRKVQLASRKNLSLCCLKLGRLQGCIEQCRLVLEVEPNNVKVVYRIGKAYLELRQFDSAEHYLRRAFYLDPQEKEVMRSLEEI